jgi:hypothetical protein
MWKILFFFIFVFFNGNECGEGFNEYYGNPYGGSDVYGDGEFRIDSPFFECFSTNKNERNKRCYSLNMLIMNIFMLIGVND